MAFRRERYDDRTAATADAPGRRTGYDFTRALFTLVGAGVAGFLVWLATLVDKPGAHTDGRWWAAMGIVAGAGLVMALSQLFGGWTKWGFPRLSAPVFLFAFLPVLVCVGWILLTVQPFGGWQQHRLTTWSSNIGILDLVRHLGHYAGVLAFGFGLTFGYSFDTTGPRRRLTHVERDRDVVVDRRAADEPLTAERTAVGTGTPTHDGTLVGSRAGAEPEPAPRTTRELE